MSNSILDQTQSKTTLPKTNPKSNPHHFSCLRLRKTSPTSQQRTLETVEIFQRSLRTGAHGHGNTILVSTWHVQGLGHQWLRSRADASHPLRPQHWSLLWRDASRYVKGGTDDDLGTWRTIDGQENILAREGLRQIAVRHVFAEDGEITYCWFRSHFMQHPTVTSSVGWHVLLSHTSFVSHVKDPQIQ